MNPSYVNPCAFGRFPAKEFAARFSAGNQEADPAGTGRTDEKIIVSANTISQMASPLTSIFSAYGRFPCNADLQLVIRAYIVGFKSLPQDAGLDEFYPCEQHDGGGIHVRYMMVSHHETTAQFLQYGVICVARLKPHDVADDPASL